MSAYGGIYRTGTDTITPVATIPVVIPMDQTMATNDVLYAPANSITINTAGVYEIFYSTTLSPSTPQVLSVAVRINGVVVPETEMSRQLGADERATFTASNIRTLAAGDVIALVVGAPAMVTVTLEQNTSAMMTVKRLD